MIYNEIEDNTKFGYIYSITNSINNKKYIGQTTNVSRRFKEHLYNRNNHPLYNSINKYGIKNFKFEIIDNAFTLDELNNKEIYYILQYNTTDRNFGYNLESGGKNSIPSIETIEKMSKSHLGIKQTVSWVDKRIAIAGSKDAKKYGNIKTTNEKQYLSENSPKYWQGKTRNDETKEKISKTKLLRGFSDKQKEANCKKVYKTNLTTKIIETFNTTKLASISENCNQSTISRWCSSNKIINNFKWSYV